MPIVEPEVLMDGDHDIDTCMKVSRMGAEGTLQELYYAGVVLEGTILKPNMVVSGKKCAKQASREEVAEKTVDRAQALRAVGGAGHRLPVRRPVG